MMQRTNNQQPTYGPSDNKLCHGNWHESCCSSILQKKSLGVCQDRTCVCAARLFCERTEKATWTAKRACTRLAMLLSACDTCSVFTCSGKVRLAAAEVAAWTVLTVRCHSLVVLSFGHFSKKVPFCQIGDKTPNTQLTAPRLLVTLLHPSISLKA